MELCSLISHISGPGLEDDKSTSSVHALANPASVLIYPAVSPNLSSLVPNVDTTASTPAAQRTAGPHEFLRGFLADVSLQQTAGTPWRRNRIQNGQQLCLELFNPSFQAAQTKPKAQGKK